MTEERKRGVSYLVQSDFDRLEDWCRLVRVVFGATPYLVGSATTRPDYRDVDIRLVVDEGTFALLSRGRLDSIRFLNRAISVWGQRETGLPIDFQVQCGTETDQFPTAKHAMGVRDWTAIPTSGVPYPVSRNRTGGDFPADRRVDVVAGEAGGSGMSDGREALVTVTRYAASRPDAVQQAAQFLFLESAQQIGGSVTPLGILEFEARVARDRLVEANQPAATVDALVAYLELHPDHVLVEAVFTAPKALMESRPDAYVAGKRGRRS